MSGLGLYKSFSSFTCGMTLALFMVIQVQLAHALPDDSNQPIHISADKALRDEKKGITIYSGNVEMKQGSMEIEADTLIIYHTTDQASEIVAKGNPAKMRQQPELDKAIVHAQGDVITYYKNEERVNLQTDARIEQDGAVVEGDSIDYFIDKEVITARSDESQDGKKVVVVIPPSVTEEDQAPPEEPPPADSPAEIAPTDSPAEIAPAADSEPQIEENSGATDSE